jgi:tetratricopeptide (TPR) repeat protein
MKKFPWDFVLFLTALCLIFIVACHQLNSIPTPEAINAIDLKRGKIILCGPPDKKLGEVVFKTSCSEKTQKDFNIAVSLLHSFEYDEAEKVFARIIDEEPGCAMAYWGVAMCNYHPLWTPPTQEELEKGSKAITIAQSLKKSERESAYINAVAAFYNNWDITDHATRSEHFEDAMERVYAAYPDDPEAAIFYALALNGAASPADTTFRRQRKAGALLTAIYRYKPDHPGVVHYIIHSYDYAALAQLALPAAKRYASIAPSSAHAQHMPSHIFTRLGLWEEDIQSNIVATNAARCYGESMGVKGHWDEELHGLDYLVYAYLQKADNVRAKEQWDYLKTIQEVHPPSFKVAYAFSAIPARYVLENRLWKDAAALQIHPVNFPWKQHTWAQAITYYARTLGNVHTGRFDAARAELKRLQQIHDTLKLQKDTYKASQLQIQIKSCEAWLLFKEGAKNEAALRLMRAAADLEDNIQKLPVTPGEILPARELLGDMLLQMNRPQEALIAYEADLKERPNRFNGLYGAGTAAEKSNNTAKAKQYYQQLANISVDSDRPELQSARRYLRKESYQLARK